MKTLVLLLSLLFPLATLAVPTPELGTTCKVGTAWIVVLHSKGLVADDYVWVLYPNGKKIVIPTVLLKQCDPERIIIQW